MKYLLFKIEKFIYRLFNFAKKETLGIPRAIKKKIYKFFNVQYKYVIAIKIILRDRFNRVRTADADENVTIDTHEAIKSAAL